MPSKNMLPKGARHRSVRAEYRAQRGAEETRSVEIPVIEDVEDAEDGVRRFDADPAAAGMRLDQYLARCIADISRARVQMLIDNGQVLVNGEAAKPKQKLHGGEAIEIEGEPRPEPLHAFAEDIPLTIVYEDEHLAVVDKPAGMMVHAGAGSTDDVRSHGTLVNALLHHFSKLSEVGGDLRPGIVHRLDRQTSGLIVVAKDDSTHRKLGDMFALRHMSKSYIALVHGWPAQNAGTVNAPISRDVVRRMRMTTRRAGGRTAVSHWKVMERIDGPWGKFTLVDVKIETGRTHQIRVHMQSLGHAVVGDTLYGAPRVIVPAIETSAGLEPMSLERNFLHAARLAFAHPQTSKPMEFQSQLPADLQEFLRKLHG